MLFSLLKHYLELYITGTALKVSRSLYCFTTSISHGVENYYARLWGISDPNFFGGQGENVGVLINILFWIHLQEFVSLLFRKVVNNKN